MRTYVEGSIEDLLLATMAAEQDIAIKPVEDGCRVRETPTHYIDIVCMLGLWRVCETVKRSPLTYDRWWDYNGIRFSDLVRATQAVIEWDCLPSTEPRLWNRNGQTFEERETNSWAERGDDSVEANESSNAHAESR